MELITTPYQDVNLLRALRDGEEAAFQALYARYSRLIYSNIYSLVKDRQAAEDLLQDVFAKIWEHRQRIEPDQSFKAYLFTISRHLSFNFKRRIKLEVETSLRLARESDINSYSTYGSFQGRETGQLVRDAIDLLPTRRRKIFMLCKLEGRSYEEVAAELNISTSTVRDHIVKANRFIRERLRVDLDIPVLVIAVSLTQGLN